MQNSLFGENSNFEIKEIENLDQYNLVEVRNSKFKEFKLLYTDGLRKLTQNVKEGSEAYQHIEVFFCLPEYWDYKVKPWPMEWIKRIADFAVSGKSWLGNGHTMPAGNPPQKLEPTFEANAFVLMRPMYLKLFLGEEFVKERNYVPLAIAPIFQQELNVKVRTSHNLLFEKFVKKGVDERIDEFRKSTCRKRLLGII